MCIPQNYLEMHFLWFTITKYNLHTYSVYLYNWSRVECLRLRGIAEQEQFNCPGIQHTPSSWVSTE